MQTSYSKRRTAELTAKTVYISDLVLFAGDGVKTISTYVTENVGWKSLDAVKEDRVGVIDISVYAQKGVILLYEQYTQLLEALKAAGKLS